MRRISIEYAKLGMMLGRAVYDGSGTLVLDASTVLDAIHLPILSRVEVREIIVQDSRVADVIIVPLISEDVEARSVRLLHRLLDENQGKLIEHVKLDLVSVDRIAKVMAQGVCSTFMGEINIEGCLSLANYDYIHPVKVAGLSLVIGKEAGYSRTDLMNLGMAALLQDIGYISVPAQILTNLSPSTEEDSLEFKGHPEFGHQLLCRYGDLDASIAEAVLQHHERWNGTGFPRGLKGDKASAFARIIALASAYHSLVSRRCGQQSYSPPEAAEFIVAYSGELFDPELVQLFIKSIALYPMGVMVKLSSGEAGIVTNSNIGFIGRPVVRICYERNGTEIANPYDLDLTDTEYQNKLIVETLEY